MEKKTTSERLKQLMDERNLRQIDILNLAKPYCQKYKVKLEKNDLSQYISGKVEPSQKKLSILAKALQVNEVWLMGYDIDYITREELSLDHCRSLIDSICLYSDDKFLKELLLKCTILNRTSVIKIIEMVNIYLIEQGDYYKDSVGEWNINLPFPNKETLNRELSWEELYYLIQDCKYFSKEFYSKLLDKFKKENFSDDEIQKIVAELNNS